MNVSPQNRYLYKPYYGSSHTWAFRHLDELAPGACVLDVGPGSGAMAKKLLHGGVTEIYAVEIDKSAIEYLDPLYRRIETTLDPFRNERFDCILLMDVLEHMTDPVQFFYRVIKMLKPGGMLLLSVPNVAHWSVRIPLLFGFFEYTERAILDRTHFQFFTRRRVRQLIDQPNLELVQLASSIEPAEFVLPKWVWDNPMFRACSVLRLALAQLLPGFFAYQHLVRLKKRGVDAPVKPVEIED